MMQSEKDKAIKKVEIAIDKMVDLQDMGFGSEAVQRAIDALNDLGSSISALPVNGKPA